MFIAPESKQKYIWWFLKWTELKLKPQDEKHLSVKFKRRTDSNFKPLGIKKGNKCSWLFKISLLHYFSNLKLVWHKARESAYLLNDSCQSLGFCKQAKSHYVD